VIHWRNTGKRGDRSTLSVDVEKILQAVLVDVQKQDNLTATTKAMSKDLTEKETRYIISTKEPFPSSKGLKRALSAGDLKAPSKPGAA